MPLPYRHRRRGNVVLVLAGLAGAIAVLGAALGGGVAPLLATAAVVAALVALFGSLTVTADAVRLAFGVGLVRRTVTLAQVAGVRTVRNHRPAGWGIRGIPGGWLFNVSGLDAVELEHRAGGVVRVGTDEPDALAAAVRAAGAAR